MKALPDRITPGVVARSSTVDVGVTWVPRKDQVSSGPTGMAQPERIPFLFPLSRFNVSRMLSRPSVLFSSSANGGRTPNRSDTANHGWRSYASGACNRIDSSDSSAWIRFPLLNRICFLELGLVSTDLWIQFDPSLRFLSLVCDFTFRFQESTLGYNFVGLSCSPSPFRVLICQCVILARFSMPICTARYGRYVPIRQVTGTRTVRYRAVSPKIDRQRSIEGEIDRHRSIEGEKGKKKKKRKRRKKRRRRKNTLCRPCPTAHHPLVAHESSPPSLAIFLLRGEKDLGDVAPF
ncbi:hypothetical protein B296_00056890, partial [Ensete ventricosum]